MLVLTPRSVDRLAIRIQRAYVRCSPGVTSEEVLDSRLWQAIAARLLVFHRADGSIPLDPELFIQAQNLRGTESVASYMGLLEASAWKRYRAQVRRIVNSLARELRGEMSRLRRWLAQGVPIEEVFYLAPRRATPLSCFLVAMLEGRPELAEDFRLACVRQHAACPLYRLAFTQFLPESSYPVRSDWGLTIDPEDFPIDSRSYILN
jgi:hypothetical protein